MKVGDYVRTKNNGIGKIISFSYQEEDECCFIELSNRRTGIKQFNIIKSSPNIIDLIEEGDYVNGERVIYKQYKEYPNPLLDHYVVDTTRRSYSEIEIKSIVTKEQFESMKYKIGE